MVDQGVLGHAHEHPNGHARMLPCIGDAGRDALVKVRERGRRIPGLARNLQRDPVRDVHAGPSFLGSLWPEKLTTWASGDLGGERVGVLEEPRGCVRKIRKIREMRSRLNFANIADFAGQDGE
jgi:hypothetical protein